jgi:hypothetical protein
MDQLDAGNQRVVMGHLLRADFAYVRGEGKR